MAMVGGQNERIMAVSTEQKLISPDLSLCQYTDQPFIVIFYIGCLTCNDRIGSRCTDEIDLVLFANRIIR